MLAEMLAGGLNANCGGRDHAPIAVERQVVRWAAEMLGFPGGAGGLLLSGSSMANFVAVLAARRVALGAGVRETGIKGVRLTAYASKRAHMCVARALDMAGLGAASLRLIETNCYGRLSAGPLSTRLESDRAAGMTPFLVVGTAGCVDTGAIDDLEGLASFCRAQQIWFHVDGAFGALAMLSPRFRTRLRGIEQADSVAFDFHKWMQVPYDAGCVVLRDEAVLRATFARRAQPSPSGLSAGEPWPVDLGPELSRGFRALKVWMTMRVFGADRLAQVVEHSCAMAERLAGIITMSPQFDLLSPVALNVVCFRLPGCNDVAHEAIASWLQDAGRSILSTTRIGGRRAFRAAFVNHRTAEIDVDALIPDILDACSALKIRLRCGPAVLS
jgi:glutamate/tyrosine decarboxylase-like PLP-dependent enzyme